MASITMYGNVLAGQSFTDGQLVGKYLSGTSSSEDKDIFMKILPFYGGKVAYVDNDKFPLKLTASTEPNPLPAGVSKNYAYLVALITKDGKGNGYTLHSREWAQAYLASGSTVQNFFASAAQLSAVGTQEGSIFEPDSISTTAFVLPQVSLKTGGTNPSGFDYADSSNGILLGGYGLTATALSSQKSLVERLQDDLQAERDKNRRLQTTTGSTASLTASSSSLPNWLRITLIGLLGLGIVVGVWQLVKMATSKGMKSYSKSSKSKRGNGDYKDSQGRWHSGKTGLYISK